MKVKCFLRISGKNQTADTITFIMKDHVGRTVRHQLQTESQITNKELIHSIIGAM